MTGPYIEWNCPIIPAQSCPETEAKLQTATDALRAIEAKFEHGGSTRSGVMQGIIEITRQALKDLEEG